MRVRYALDFEDVDAVDDLFAANNDFLGFVMRVSLEEAVQKKQLLVCEDILLEEVLGAVHFRMTKRGYITIYEIAAKHKGLRIGDILIGELKKYKMDIKLKVTEDNEGAIKFYKRNGFEQQAIEQGKKRNLIVMYYTSPRQRRLF